MDWFIHFSYLVELAHSSFMKTPVNVAKAQQSVYLRNKGKIINLLDCMVGWFHNSQFTILHLSGFSNSHFLGHGLDWSQCTSSFFSILDTMKGVPKLMGLRWSSDVDSKLVFISMSWSQCASSSRQSCFWIFDHVPPAWVSASHISCILELLWSVTYLLVEYVIYHQYWFWSVICLQGPRAVLVYLLELWCNGARPVQQASVKSTSAKYKMTRWGTVHVHLNIDCRFGSQWLSVSIPSP